MNRESKYRHEDGGDVEETPQRSIFSERWFRTVLAVVALAVVAVFAVPYLLDWWSPAPPRPTPLAKVPIPPPPPPLKTGPAQKVEAPTPPPVTPAKPEPTPSQIPAQAPQLEAKATGKPEARAGESTREQPTAKSATGGDYWIQVGAFKEQANAVHLAARLTAEKYPVQRLSLNRPVPGAHEVVVVGASPREVSGKLPTKDYRAVEVGADVVIRPGLPLKDAVNLSKDLSRQGFTVKIRRSRSTATFHVVRVGGYPDRKLAQTAQKDLAGKGFPGFVVKGEGR